MIVDDKKLNIPCRDCLVLAACKHKREVRCSLLTDWSTREWFGFEDYWKIIHGYLPKVTDIYMDGDRSHVAMWKRSERRKRK